MRTILTSADLIERMAADSGRSIEIHNDAAFLSVGGTVWYAPLAKAGA
jgi:hypothetical protein